jgi:hypothetical protein
VVVARSSPASDVGSIDLVLLERDLHLGDAKARAEVVPGHAASSPSEPVQLGLVFDAATSEPLPTVERASGHPWAWLLARVFAVDAMVCPQCTGPMRVVKIATTGEELAKARTHAGLGARPLPRQRPAMLGQLEICFRDS